MWTQWLGWEGGCCPRGLPWGEGHTWTPTWLMLCSLLPGTAWPSASSTVAPASWPALPSSQSWASWPGSRVCPSLKWLNLVSGAVVGQGRGVLLFGPPQQGEHTRPGPSHIAAAGSHPGGQLCFLPPKTREKQIHAHETLRCNGHVLRSMPIRVRQLLSLGAEVRRLHGIHPGLCCAPLGSEAFPGSQPL